MARKNDTQTSNHLTIAPDFLAWHVTNRGAKSFWNKVGAAWKHKDGHGYPVLPAEFPGGPPSQAGSSLTTGGTLPKPQERGQVQPRP